MPSLEPGSIWLGVDRLSPPQARLFDEPQLASLCLENIDKNTADAITAEGFTDIDLGKATGPGTARWSHASHRGPAACPTLLLPGPWTAWPRAGQRSAPRPWRPALADGPSPADTLVAVLERDTLGIREVRLFNAVVRWSEAECQRQQLQVTPENKRKVLGKALALIRFPLMTIEEFAAGNGHGAPRERSGGV